MGFYPELKKYIAGEILILKRNENKKTTFIAPVFVFRP